MPLAGDSILVTPGSGATIATHTKNSKEHEVWMGADTAGNLSNNPVGLYASSALEMTRASNKNYISLFNADAALIVDVLGVWIAFTITAESGAGAIIPGYRLFFTNSTTHSAGTLLTPVKLDSTSGALDADITVRSNGQTVTASGEAINSISQSEKTSGGSGGSGCIGGFKFWLWQYQDMNMSIVLRQNQGIVVQQGGIGDTSGNISAGVIFRVR